MEYNVYRSNKWNGRQEGEETGGKTMYKRFEAPLGVRIWRDIRWGFGQLIEAVPDVLAGIGMAGIFVLLPIIAGIIIG